MQTWNNIIQTAMLGTAKKQPYENDIAQELAEAASIINNNETIDSEEKFLQLAAVTFNYRQSGVLPSWQSFTALPVAAPEEKQYCSVEATQALKDILYEESSGLLKIWLQCCTEKRQLIPPSLIPVILDKSVQQKQLKPLVQQCAGSRGAWLSQFNREWSFAQQTNDDELWQTGTPDQRKQVLQQLRNNDPAKAREWLQQTWAQENANSRTEFLKIFSVNLSDDDIAWLETLLNEKSQKVKRRNFEFAETNSRFINCSIIFANTKAGS